jgi:hypothetical protein
MGYFSQADLDIDEAIEDGYMDFGKHDRTNNNGYNIPDEKEKGGHNYGRGKEAGNETGNYNEQGN